MAKQLLKNKLSILIPSYNCRCTEMVRYLQQLCHRIALTSPEGLMYEIIVADDCSPNLAIAEANSAINNILHCRYIRLDANGGAAATRNYLARQAKYPWLLFLDSDMQIPGIEFLMRYLNTDNTPVINGGIALGGDHQQLCHNLRYRYERSALPAHTPDRRNLRPYQAFRSANFMIERSVMMAHPFDERFKKSGYEDVMLGKALAMAQVTVKHIDNALLLTEFENNADYMAKCERSLHVLRTFRHDLQGYSRLADMADRITRWVPAWLIKGIFMLVGNSMRRQLTGSNPSLRLFNLYRIGYYIART